MDPRGFVVAGRKEGWPPEHSEDFFPSFGSLAAMTDPETLTEAVDPSGQIRVRRVQAALQSGSE